MKQEATIGWTPMDQGCGQQEALLPPSCTAAEVCLVKQQIYHRAKARDFQMKKGNNKSSS
uniref:Uncharacterized protein n=1 Tax=Romanomermis culicivorax TaxID=13658 RepID=A0A915JS26_ROMCU